MQFPCLTMLKKLNDQEQMITYASWIINKSEIKGNTRLPDYCCQISVTLEDRLLPKCIEYCESVTWSVKAGSQYDAIKALCYVSVLNFENDALLLMPSDAT